MFPDQAPEALHAVAFADDHESVALAPLLMALGPTLRLTVGSGALTETVVDCAALPAGPRQVSVYVALCVSAPVKLEPLVALLPDQPPEAVQAVTLAEDHVRVALPPEAMVLGLALMVTVGVAEATDTVADCVALPPNPVQVSE